MGADIQLHFRSAVAELVLVPPEGRPPTLDQATLALLDAHLASLESAGERVRLVVLRSASPKYFCVGADLNALRHLDATSIVPWVEQGHRVFNRLANLPLPVIARVTGFALGGGLELALAADFIWATPESKLAQTEARLGFVAGWGGSWRLPRRIGAARAKDLFFTGRMISAADALAIGLVDVCATAEELDARCAQFATDISACSPVAVRELKRLVAAAPSLAQAESMAAEAGASVSCLRSPDTQRRVAEFLGRKQKPGPPAQG